MLIIVMRMLTSQLNSIPKKGMISTEPGETDTPNNGQHQKEICAVLFYRFDPERWYQFWF